MADEQSGPAERASWRRVFAAPWLGVIRPGTAATMLAAAPSRRVWTMYFAHVAVLAAIVVLLAMGDATVRRIWEQPTTIPTTMTAGGPAMLPYSIGESRIDTRTLGDVWRDWHVDGLIGPAEIVFLFVSIFICFGTMFLAWLNLPRVHRQGPVWPAASRSFFAVATAGGLLTALTVATGALILVANREDRLASRGAPLELVVGVWTSILLGTIFLLERIGRAAAVLGTDAGELELPPRCAGCGYDLSHQPANGLCPECGYSVGQSVGPECRPGISWERPAGRRFQTWVETTWSAITESRAFYGGLRLRTPSKAASVFATRTYAWIGVVAGAWTLVCIGLLEVWRDWKEPVSLALITAFSIALGCWLVHRLVGAVVIAWWIYRGALPDTRWAAKVLAYEAAFLWILCAYWGLLATSFVVMQKPWITELFGEEFFFNVFGVPGEVVVVLGGTGLLLLAWLWRYLIALRAVRWSNF